MVGTQKYEILFKDITIFCPHQEAKVTKIAFLEKNACFPAPISYMQL